MAGGAAGSQSDASANEHAKAKLVSHVSVAVVCEESVDQAPWATGVGRPTQGVTAGAADSPAASNKHFNRLLGKH